MRPSASSRPAVDLACRSPAAVLAYRIGIICGGGIVACIFAVMALAISSVADWICLDILCRDAGKNRAAKAEFTYPATLQFTRLDRAGTRYLIAYIGSLGYLGAATRAREVAIEEEADLLVPGMQFVDCMHKLNTEACLQDYVLNLPGLAETFQRCAVSQCRRHAREEKARSAGGASLRLAYDLLAEQTQELARIFTRHEKFEIADRAYQDAISSASLAVRCDPVSLNDFQRLQRFYLAYACFLCQRHRYDDALSWLSRMNKICR